MTGGSRGGKKAVAPPAPKTRDEREAELLAQRAVIQTELNTIAAEKEAERAAARMAKAKVVFAAVPALLQLTDHATRACDEDSPWGVEDECPRCLLRRCQIDGNPVERLADLRVVLS